MGNRLLQELVLIGLAAVALGLFGFRRSRTKGQRLRFDARGLVAVSGLVQRGERDSYLFEGESGQYLGVALDNRERNAVLQIHCLGQMGETLPGAAQGDGARAWQGRLPLTGTYQIVVSPALGPAAYVLRLEQRGKRPLGGLRGPRRSARPEDHAKAIGQADKESPQQRRRSLGADGSRQAAFEARTPAAETDRRHGQPHNLPGASPYE